MRHKRIIEHLLSNNTTHGRHLTAIVQFGNLVDVGYNRQADPPFKLGYKDKRHNIHSEIACFRKARGLLDLRRPFDVINIRFRMDGSIAMACPCWLCHNFLYASGCKHVIYSNDVGTFSSYPLG